MYVRYYVDEGPYFSDVPPDLLYVWRDVDGVPYLSETPTGDLEILLDDDGVPYYSSRGAELIVKDLLAELEKKRTRGRRTTVRYFPHHGFEITNEIDLYGRR